MMKTFSTKLRLEKFAACTAIIMLIPFTAVQAAVISADISISAETMFDNANSFGDTSGEFSLISGAATTTNSYTGSTAVGTNPFSGTLLNTGDGIGFTGVVSVTDEAFIIGFDSVINLQNTSASMTYDIIFKLVFSNTVNSFGLDAYADSEFVVFEGDPQEFFSDIKSDTVNGNEVAGVLVDPAASGGTLSESSTELFNYVLNPLDTFDLSLFWTLEGGDFDTGSSEASFSQFLSIDSVIARSVPPVPSVPGPNSLSIFVLALAGLVAKQISKSRKYSN